MKRKLFILLIINVVFILTAMSQQENSGFLFRDFQDATVYFSGGAYSNEKVNYNVTEKELYYIDKVDGLVKIVANIETIRIVKLDDRSFIQANKGLQEIIPTTPFIYVEYFPKVQTKASNVGYGMTSSVSSTSALNYLGQRGYYLSESQKQETTGFNCRYSIEKNEQNKKFATFKQLLKIYPKHKDVLNGYIKENNVNFNDIEAIVNLCLYAESLN